MLCLWEGLGGSGMRWWAVGWMVAGLVAIAGCSSSSEGDAAAGPSGSRSVKPPTGASARTPAGPSTSETASPTAGNPSAPAGTPSSAVPGCAAGHVKVAISPGDERRTAAVRCVRGRGYLSSCSPGQTTSGGEACRARRPCCPCIRMAGDADGTAHATLRCAGTRAGKAKITALVKAPDVAGAVDGALRWTSAGAYPRQGDPRAGIPSSLSAVVVSAAVAHLDGVDAAAVRGRDRSGRQGSVQRSTATAGSEPTRVHFVWPGAR